MNVNHPTNFSEPFSRFQTERFSFALFMIKSTYQIRLSDEEEDLL